MKVCCRCKICLSLSEFHKNKSNKDGYSYTCKNCVKFDYETKYREEVIARAKGWYEDNVDRKVAYDKQRRIDKKDYLKAYEAARSNLPHRRELSRKWATENPERVKEIKLKSASKWYRVYYEKYKYLHVRNARNYRHKLQMYSTNEFDDLVLSEAYDLATRRKVVSGFDWHVDHVSPIRGKFVSGLNNAYNIEVVPAQYNRQKSNKEWDRLGCFGVPA